MRAPTFCFFHDQLPDDASREVYCAVEDGIRKRSMEIACPRSPVSTEYMCILEHVYDDHPEFFSFYPLSSKILLSTTQVIIQPFYRYSASDSRQYAQALEDASQAILNECFPRGVEKTAELEREKRIFDWMTDHIVYDNPSCERLKTDGCAVDSMAWNAYGALVLRKAVCEGVACGFKLLCDRAGLPCIVVLGMAGERHAWNIVRIKDRFYHVDCTWNLKSTVGREIPYMRYRYFNLPDEIISLDHTAESRFLPRCGSLRFNPFYMRGLCASTMESVLPMALRQIQAGNRRFALICVGFKATIDFVTQIADQLAKEAGMKNLKWYQDSTGAFIGFILP